MHSVVTAACLLRALFHAVGGLLVFPSDSYPPFFDDKPFGIYEKILAGKVEFPKHVDPIARSVSISNVSSY